LKVVAKRPGSLHQCWHLQRFAARHDYVGGNEYNRAIEATPTVRLSELWLECQVEPVSLRFLQPPRTPNSPIATQPDLPAERLVDDRRGQLARRWPCLSTVGGWCAPIRVAKGCLLLFAIFNGDPAPPCPNADPDTCNRYGVNFRLSDPAFMIVNLQWR
jgi:hypothetical protein